MTTEGTVRSTTVLGLCWIAFGILRLIAAIWMFSFTGTATVMFGAWLVRVPNPYSLMNAFHFIYSGWIILSAASGIFSLIAGILLLGSSNSSRKVALIAAFLSAGFVPLGTTLGVYTMVLFLRRD